MIRSVDAILRIFLVALVLVGSGFALKALAADDAAPADEPWWVARLEPPSPPNADERLLGVVASEIAGRAVSVRCVGEELPDYGPSVVTHGAVWFYGDRPANYTVIAPNICRELLRVRAGGLSAADVRCLREWAGLGCGDRVAPAALAMATLAHESFHLAGVRDEPTADCYAIQTVELVATRLGLGRGEAGGLAAFAKVNHRVGQGAEYESGECREGGALDLDPSADGGLG
jgi:hypothetical protein